jgi:hypothetical protein
MSKLDELNQLIDEMIKRAEKIINSPDTTGTFEITQTTLDTNIGGSIVVGIGCGLAPEGLEKKCLILNNKFAWKVIDDGDHIFLVPKVKE